VAQHEARVPIALGKDVYGQPIMRTCGNAAFADCRQHRSGNSGVSNSIIASSSIFPDQLSFGLNRPQVVSS